VLQYEYAKAIFELAGNELAVSIKDELNLVVKLLEDTEFNKFMNSPSIKIDDKKSVIKESLKEFNELTLNFLYVLLDNQRFYLIDEIYKEYDKLLLNNKKFVDVKLYSSSKLTDEQINKLKPIILSKLNCENINVENIVDETLIGGIVIYANDLKIDISTKGNLQRLKDSL
jgi:F-type H+-transporting ATPase subunit delta